MSSGILFLRGSGEEVVEAGLKFDENDTKTLSDILIIVYTFSEYVCLVILT